MTGSHMGDQHEVDNWTGDYFSSIIYIFKGRSDAVIHWDNFGKHPGRLEKANPHMKKKTTNSNKFCTPGLMAYM